MSQLISASGEPRSGLADFLPFIPSARVYASVVQAIGNSAEATVTFDLEQTDTDTVHDNVTNNGRLTAVHAGQYLVQYSVNYGANAGGARYAYVRKNGATQVGQRNDISAVTGAANASLHDSMILDLAAGDYVELRTFQSSGGVLNLDATLPPAFAMTYIGPGFNAVRVKPVISYVTPVQFAALTPLDGDEVYLVVDATNGIVWHLRYNAGSSSAYKWEFLGGSDLGSRVDAGDTLLQQASYTILSTVQSITVPRGGEYVVEFGGEIARPANASSDTRIAPKFGSAAVSDNDMIRNFSSDANDDSKSLSRVLEPITLVTGDAVSLYYKNLTANTGGFTRRFLRVRPRRIS